MGPVWNMLIVFAYLGAGIAALAMAIWLASGQRQHGAAAKACIAALALSAFWAFAVIGLGPNNLITALALSALYLGWLWMLYRMFGHDARDKNLSPIRPVVSALALVEFLQIAIVFAWLQYAGQAGAELLIARFAIILRLLFCIGALVLVHNLYVGASQESRQNLRWPAAAMAVLWLYELNLYTVAYLGDSMPALLRDLRSVALLVAALLLGFGTARDESELRFRPSRSFAFQSFSLLLIGGYLLVMVIIAQGITYTGSESAGVLQTGFVLLASVLALTVLPSKKLRGWLRVTLSKHLFAHRYDYRAEWLRFTNTIGRAGPSAPPLPERIVQSVADIADSPKGLLLIPREDGGLVLAARWQWPQIDVPGLPLSADAAAFFEESQFILDLDDIRAGHEQAIPKVAYPEWLLANDEAWGMVPLLHYERLVGVVVLARAKVARRLDWEDFDLLRVVGRQLASYLAEQDSQDALGEAQRFDEFNRRIAFVMHDIKNLASQLSLLAGNAEKHADKPEFRADMLITLRNSTDKLQALLARLGRYGTGGASERRELRLDLLIERIAAQYAATHEIITSQNGKCVVLADEEALEQALAHLVQNAIEASDDGSPVTVDLRVEGDQAQIAVVDSGHGMSTEFVRTRLFKPFHSSKPGGFGIGAFEARELVRAMDGRLDVESREGLGTQFTIRLPLSEKASLIKSFRAQTQTNASEVA